jgi:hypothetical protein
MNHDFRTPAVPERELAWRRTGLGASLAVALLSAGLWLVASEAGATHSTPPVPCDEVHLALGSECICY